MNPLITYVTTCKGRLGHLRQSLPRVAAQPGVRIVVVDYDCPDHSGQWVSENFPQARVVRIDNAPGFVVSRARNAGGAVAETPWIAFFDADILVSDDFFGRVSERLAPGFHYRANPLTLQTWGSVICERDAFREVGGYDTVYRGWGVEDDDFYSLLEFSGSRRAAMDGRSLSEIDHDDEARTRFHSDAKLASHQRNQVYRAIKFDLMRLGSGYLPLELREQLYGQVSSRLDEDWKSGRRSLDIRVDVPEHVIQHPRDIAVKAQGPVSRLGRSLNYRLTWNFDVSAR